MDSVFVWVDIIGLGEKVYRRFGKANQNLEVLTVVEAARQEDFFVETELFFSFSSCVVDTSMNAAFRFLDYLHLCSQNNHVTPIR